MSPKFEQHPAGSATLFFHICVFQWGCGKGGGGGCRGIRRARPVVKQGGHAEIPAGSWLLQLAALEASTHPVRGAIPYGARPLDHRTTTQDGLRSQLAGILGPWLPTACCRAGGRPGDPGNTEQDGMMGWGSGRTPGGGSQVLRLPCESPRRVNSPSISMDSKMSGQ